MYFHAVIYLVQIQGHQICFKCYPCAGTWCACCSHSICTYQNLSRQYVYRMYTYNRRLLSQRYNRYLWPYPCWYSKRVPYTDTFTKHQYFAYYICYGIVTLYLWSYINQRVLITTHGRCALRNIFFNLHRYRAVVCYEALSGQERHQKAGGCPG